MLKKWLLITAISALFIAWANASYTEVQCSSDWVFWDYSCNQCFDWGILKNWDNISFLDDLWVNSTTNKKIMYKEEQTMPKMNALNDAVINQKPNTDAFWEYTSEFEALKSKELDGYVLEAWKQISWLKSAMWAAYNAEKLPEEWKNAWILVYDIMSHNILANNEITTNDTAHKECVLFKSAQKPIKEVVKEPTPEPKQMTQVKTWPELYFAVIILSLLMWVVVMNRKTIFANIKK